jgi:HPt (histidine-containing phosphotransfer) domain-containing protein
MDPTSKADLTSALDLLWKRFLPQILDRISVLETAAKDCIQGSPRGFMLRTARDAAHKLAGSLGTFNLTRGTVLARELELFYSNDPDLSTEAVAHLVKITIQLRQIVENRPPSGGA